jgi:LmbE family N-acetylglucosaminyl deacetylase
VVYIISPHIDDACFSLGLTIEMYNSLGDQIRIVNCFTVSNFTINKNIFDVEQVTAIRKGEDQKLARQFKGLIFENLGLLDAPLRKELIRQKLPLNVNNQLLVLKIADFIISSIPTGSSLFCPLSIGNHIDHLICMEAAILVSRKNLYVVSFYEDLPYTSRCTAEEISKKILYIQDCTGMQLISDLISVKNYSTKEKMLQCYSSQLDGRINDEIMGYTAIHGGERIWVPIGK